MHSNQISASELQQKIQQQEPLLLLDVRENNEFEFVHIKDSLHIPLNQIPARMAEISYEGECVVICHHGVRSQQALNFLSNSGFGSLFNLVGGIDAWSVSCDNSLPRY